MLTCVGEVLLVRMSLKSYLRTDDSQSIFYSYILIEKLLCFSKFCSFNHDTPFFLSRVSFYPTFPSICSRERKII